jgi:hypothetical protein
LPDIPAIGHSQSEIGNTRALRCRIAALSQPQGGHRVKAIKFVDQAMDEVKKGIEAGE